MKLRDATYLATAASLFALAVVARGSEPAATLRPVSAFVGIADPAARSVALFGEMGKVLTHPRCLNCHPRGDVPTQGLAMLPHDPPVVRGADGRGAPGMECATCHGSANVALVSGRSMPGDPAWHLAPIKMAWQGRTLGEICRQLRDPDRNGGKSFDALVEHNGHDHLVGWAWRPGAGRAPAPGSQSEFGALTRAWVDSGARCPA